MRYRVAQAHCEWLQQLLAFHDHDPGNATLRSHVSYQAQIVKELCGAVLNNPIEGKSEAPTSPDAEGGAA